MTSDPESKKTRTGTRKGRSKPYIPNLAEFYFQPTYDWSRKEAERLFNKMNHDLGEYTPDIVNFKECISGMRELPKSCIDLVIADPPFGIEFDGRSSVYNRDDSLVIPGYEEVQGSYNEFTKQWLAELPRIMKNNASAYIFSGWNNLDSILNAARNAGLTTLNHLIWHYPFGVFTKRRFVTSHYHILLLVKSEKSYFFNKIENYPEDVWIVKRRYRTGMTKNSTKLPLDVVTKCIDYSSRPGDLILDPFMGNGTTAVAAKSTFRHFVGFEINTKLKSHILKEINSVTLGQMYKSYKERLPSIEELAELYPRAYREYLKQEGQK